MSISAVPTETAWQGIDAGQVAGIPSLSEKKAPATAGSTTMKVETLPRNADVVIDSGTLASLRQSESTDGLRFLGRVVIPGIFSLPEQNFTLQFSKHGFVIKSHPSDSWPQLAIECESDSATQDFKIKDVVWRLATETVDGWLRHTCIILSLARAGGFSVEAESIDLVFDVEYDPSFGSEQAESEQRMALQMARLIRKLKYIESCFNVKFSLLPDTFSPQEVQDVEIVFRGITEGVFTTRRQDYTFEKISSSDVDVSVPPFDGPGPFSQRIKSTVSIFGKQLDVGPVTVSLANAELASPGIIQDLYGGSKQVENARFEVLDNQITYRFESYSKESRKHRMQRLNRFKKELARKEPVEIVSLVDERLQGDVSSGEALQIAVGWTQHHDLPDRYCPQEPEVNVAGGNWRVPIYLVYSNGEGGAVGEVVIDEKTGLIVSHTPVDELRSKGRTLAEQILHA